MEVANGGLLSALDTANNLKEQEKVDFATPLVERQMTRKALPNDTLINQQWHLKNTGGNAVSPAVAGNDINIESIWPTYTGTGINIGVTDDGLQTNHPDLAANARTDIDIDINYNDLDPNPALTDPGPNTSSHPFYIDAHGTSAAGVAAAKGNNGLGVAGAAYNAGLVGIRLISAGTTDLQESQAMLHRITDANAANVVSINSNSWGPADDGATLDDGGPFPLAKAALEAGATTGRNGKGTIYTWAAGNGSSADNANFDGYANSRFTIAVAASAANGTQSSYSEQGACVLVNAPSSYGSGGIVTADRTGSSGFGQNGYNTGDYTCNTASCGFGGTSSACPLVAGVVALILEANPNLTWRDVQHILVETSTKNSPTDVDWIANGDGKLFNHKFGFGRVNTASAVGAALIWGNKPAAMPVTVPKVQPQAIPDNNATGISQTASVTGVSNVKLEHVELTVNLSHTYRGDMELFLTSPSGMISRIATTRGGDGPAIPGSPHNFNNWTFMTVAHWGEDPNGTWTLKAADRFANDVGTLNSWTLKVHGSQQSASAGDWQLYN